MRCAPTPTDVTQLRAFLGAVNYYGPFLKNLSTCLDPLYKLLRKEVPFKWTKECQTAFDSVKEQLSNASFLCHYDQSKKLILACDASSYGVGAVISHIMPDGSERPIAYASRTLSPSERHYSQVEREGLAIVFGIQKYHKYLYGRKFTLITDHRPLVAIFGSKKGIPTIAAARLQRWALSLSAYDYDIQYKKGEELANADVLSRLPLNDDKFHESQYRVYFVDKIPIDAHVIAKCTKSDPILRKVFYYIVNGWPNSVDNALIPYKRICDNLSTENGCILNGYRVVVPTTLRANLLKELHVNHIGIVRMKSVARGYFWWPNIDDEIEKLAKSCHQCQMSQKQPAIAPLHPWPICTEPWERVHIDYAEKDGHKYLLAIDSYSRWPEIICVSSTTSTKTIEALRTMFAAYGIPKMMVSDNAPQFKSDEFSQFLKLNGVRQVNSPPYHSASNGMVERLVQTFKSSLERNSGSNVVHKVQKFLFRTL